MRNLKLLLQVYRTFMINVGKLGNVTLRDDEAEIQAEVVGNSEGENDQIT